MMESITVAPLVPQLEWVEIDGCDCGFRQLQGAPGERWECVALVRVVVFTKRPTAAFYAIDELTEDGFRVWHAAADQAAARASAEAALTL